MNVIESGLLAVAGTSLAIAALRPLSAKLHLVDIPNQRKQHVGAIPLIGGIAICIGVLLSMVLTLPQEPALQTLMTCGVFIVILGAIDDARDISPWLRLGVQALLVIIMCKGTGVTLHQLGDIVGVGDISVRWFDLILTVIAICGAINAYNMMDGIDGLAGSMAMISFIGLAVLLHDQMPLMADFSQLFILALLPYLCVNLSLFSSKRKIFLGDAGSMLLGFVIGFMVIFGSQQTHDTNAFRPVAALWIIGLPLIDMVGIMIRRIRKGQSPLQADRNHFHHILLHAGFSAKQSLYIMIIINGIIVSIGLVGEMMHVPESVMMALFAIVFAGYVYLQKRAFVFGQYIKSLVRTS